jgi:hypothetical protein
MHQLVFLEFGENLAELVSDEIRVSGSEYVQQALMFLMVLREVIGSLACGILKLGKFEQIERKQRCAA